MGLVGPFAGGIEIAPWVGCLLCSQDVLSFGEVGARLCAGPVHRSELKHVQAADDTLPQHLSAEPSAPEYRCTVTKAWNCSSVMLPRSASKGDLLFLARRSVSVSYGHGLRCEQADDARREDGAGIILPRLEAMEASSSLKLKGKEALPAMKPTARCIQQAEA